MKKDKLSSLLGFYMAMGLYASGEFSSSPPKEYKKLTEEEKERLTEQIKREKRRRLLSKGLKEFTIDGITVLALNEKNALRKVNKNKNRV